MTKPENVAPSTTPAESVDDVRNALDKAGAPVRHGDHALSQAERVLALSSRTMAPGWVISTSGDEVAVIAPDCNPGGTFVTNKGRLEQRLLFALGKAIAESGFSSPVRGVTAGQGNDPHADLIQRLEIFATGATGCSELNASVLATAKLLREHKGTAPEVGRAGCTATACTGAEA